MHDLNALQPQIKEKEEKDTFAIGDYVQIQDLNSHGEIIDVAQKRSCCLNKWHEDESKNQSFTKDEAS